MITGLKIASSVTHGLPYGQVTRDARKLQAILATGRKHAANDEHPMPLAFMCVLDNYPTWRLNREVLARYQDRTGRASGVEWLVGRVDSPG